MPKKRNPDATYGQKLIRLFAELLFTGRKRSLTELSKMLDCSKQTVARLVDDITVLYSVSILQEKLGRQNFFWIERPEKMPLLPLSGPEIAALEMSRAFSRNLLGQENYETAMTGLQKSIGMLPPEKIRSCGDELGSLASGHIDYSPFREMLDSLIKAVSEKRVCTIRYQNLMADAEKDFCIMPIKIFAHKDTIYIHSRRCTEKGLPKKDDAYAPLLALHRFRDIRVLEATFSVPNDFDFETTFAASFGVIKEKTFRAAVEFTGWSARYVAERIWSPDQKIVRKRDGEGIRLEFSASSESEVMAWVLSFGEEAQLVKPVRLRKRLVGKLKEMVETYHE